MTQKTELADEVGQTLIIHKRQNKNIKVCDEVGQTLIIHKRQNKNIIRSADEVGQTLTRIEPVGEPYREVCLSP